MGRASRKKREARESALVQCDRPVQFGPHVTSVGFARNPVDVLEELGAFDGADPDRVQRMRELCDEKVKRYELR